MSWSVSVTVRVTLRATRVSSTATGPEPEKTVVSSVAISSAAPTASPR